MIPGSLTSIEGIQRLFENPPTGPERFLPRDDHIRDFCEFGVILPFYAYDNIIEERRASCRLFIDSVNHHYANSVWFDTTTLVSVEKLLLRHDGSYVTAETLFDLSTFVEAVLLYDNLLHVENPQVDSLAINEALGNTPILIPCHVPEFDIGGEGNNWSGMGLLLEGAWYETLRYFHNLCHSDEDDPFFEDKTELIKSWNALLNIELSFNVMFNTMLTTHTFASRGPQLLDELVSSYEFEKPTNKFFKAGSQSQKEMLSEIASECNLRGCFNIVFSRALKLPYMPNVLRLPVAKSIALRASNITQQLHLVKFVNREFRTYSDEFKLGDTLELNLPLFLTAILKKSLTPMEFCDYLLELRHAAEPLRKNRQTLNESIINGDYKVAEEMKKALKADTASLLRFIPYGLAALIPLVSPSPAISTLTLASVAVLTFGAKYSKDDVGFLMQRFRPELRFLQQSSNIAQQMTNALPKIKSFWSIKDSRVRKIKSRWEGIVRMEN